jgi:hypothetical protein
MPAGSQSLKKIPSGVIHDWLGAAFIANTMLNQVLSFLRDYDRYKEFYAPTVIDSRVVARGNSEDRFSMVLMNKSLFLKAALDSDYQCTYVRVSNRRWYGTTESTRVQEIENYGAASQRALREGEGSGFIWRLFSITRFEERDGGVYVELEAIALSRDIPSSLRWILEPIVSRISRTSLITSLRQTEAAVRSGAVIAEGKRLGDGPSYAKSGRAGILRPVLIRDPDGRSRAHKIALCCPPRAGQLWPGLPRTDRKRKCRQLRRLAKRNSQSTNLGESHSVYSCAQQKGTNKHDANSKSQS